MQINFDPEEKFLVQAEEIIDLYGRNLFSETISCDEISPEFIKQINNCRSNVLFVQILADDLTIDGNGDWNITECFDELEDEIVAETCRRIHWLYGGKKAIAFDKYVVARVLKFLDEVATEDFMKDFL